MTMTLERFADLADAYGADLRRWPQGEREGAEALLARAPEARRLLETADELDAFLDVVPRAVASNALRERVLAQAAGAGLGRRQLRRTASWWAMAWLSGAGWTAAAFAGVAFGLSVTSTMTAEQQAEAVFYQASLDATDDTEVLGG